MAEVEPPKDKLGVDIQPAIRPGDLNEPLSWHRRNRELFISMFTSEMVGYSMRAYLAIRGYGLASHSDWVGAGQDFIFAAGSFILAYELRKAQNYIRQVLSTRQNAVTKS